MRPVGDSIALFFIPYAFSDRLRVRSLFILTHHTITFTSLDRTPFGLDTRMRISMPGAGA